MKKSRIVELGLLLSIAGALTGCSRREARVDQRCVDANGVVVDDKYCAQQEQQRPGTTGGSPGVVGGFYPYPYRWYYGGSGTPMGSRVAGGAYEPPPNAAIVRPNSGGSVVGHTSTGGSSVRGFFGGSSGASGG